MATRDGGNGEPRDWKRRESLGSALAQVGGVAVLLAVAVFIYVQRSRVKEELDTRMKTARSLAQRGNPEDLQAALRELDGIFALDANAYDAHVLAADLQASLWLEHHVPAAESQVREHLQRAEALESPSSGRYGTKVVRALMQLHEGQANEAAQALLALEAKGASSPRLLQALGRAHQARGNLVEARQALAQAMEAAWKDPRYATTYGEALLDEGQYGQAAEALRKATIANASYTEARLLTALASLYRRDKVDAARSTVQELTAREEQLTPALKALLLAVRAELALNQGNADEALREADAALAFVPDAHYALFARARALAAKKDAGTRAAFEQAVAKRRTAPLLYLDGARALQEAGDGAGALALLDSYEATFRDVKVPVGEGKTAGALERDDRYWLARGGVLEAVGRQDDALATYDLAIASRGLSLGRAQYAKGALLLARKDYTGARPLLEPLAPVDGSGMLAEAYAAMGDLLLAGGDTQGGYQHYVRSLLRQKAQGVPAERVKARAEELGKRLTAVIPTLAKDWEDATAQVLAAP